MSILFTKKNNVYKTKYINYNFSVSDVSDNKKEVMNCAISKCQS